MAKSLASGCTDPRKGGSSANSGSSAACSSLPGSSKCSFTKAIRSSNGTSPARGGPQCSEQAGREADIRARPTACCSRLGDAPAWLFERRWKAASTSAGAVRSGMSTKVLESGKRPADWTATRSSGLIAIGVASSILGALCFEKCWQMGGRRRSGSARKPDSFAFRAGGAAPATATLAALREREREEGGSEERRHPSDEKRNKVARRPPARLGSLEL